MKTVLFLGAGASADAGYPVTAHLLREMERHVSDTPFHQDRKDWELFKEFRESTNEPLSTILRSSNPELVLTIPDLLEAALNDGDAENWRQVKAAVQNGNQDNLENIHAYWNDPRRDQLAQGVLAKRAFQRLADNFFSHKHCYDSQDSGRNRRCYLEKAFASLKKDDTVITTNWDTLAERVLLDQGRWFPTDGYGFKVLIVSGPEWDPGRQRRLNRSSQIKVLKLHGSTGWFRNEGESGGFYLRSPSYLQYLVPPGHAEIRDAQSPPPGHGDDLNPVVVFPSYLKQLDDEVLQSIWDRAAKALYSSGHITFVGYSLPLADVAVRALLNPIRKRLSEGKCSVTVVIGTDAQAETRWKAFLGSEVEVVKKTAKEFFG